MSVGFSVVRVVDYVMAVRCTNEFRIPKSLWPYRCSGVGCNQSIWKVLTIRSYATPNKLRACFMITHLHTIHLKFFSCPTFYLLPSSHLNWENFRWILWRWVMMKHDLNWLISLATIAVEDEKHNSFAATYTTAIHLSELVLWSWIQRWHQEERATKRYLFPAHSSKIQENTIIWK